MSNPELIVALRNAAPAILAAAREASELRAALTASRERERVLREAIATILAWDVLNPPQTGLCVDFPWLRDLAEKALAATDPKP